MKKTDFERLQIGDILQNNGSGTGYVVIETDHGKRVIASRTLEISNPEEWTLVRHEDQGAARFELLEEMLKLAAYHVIVTRAPIWWQELAYRWLWERYGLDHAMAYEKAIREVEVLK